MPMFDQTNFADRVRTLILERNVSQVEVSAQIGIDRSSLSRICDLKQKPNVETYLRLVKWVEDPNFTAQY